MATINAQVRGDNGKMAARRLRRSGRVPGILYGGGQDPLSLSVELKEFLKLIETEGGALKTKQSSMDLGTSGRIAVLVREVQRHPVNQTPIHVDFTRFDPNQRVEIHVPIHFVDEEKSVGVKRGGIIQHIARELVVFCLAGSIPEYIEVSMAALDIGDSIHLSDIVLPAGVEVHADSASTIASVVGARGDQGEDEAAAAG